ncbi:hypothetical protein BGLA2_2340013 [Burkholderia gladioli]|nr:hypothetical protein BGLA2_2340013 [Burkholderia gladioli]
MVRCSSRASSRLSRCATCLLAMADDMPIRSAAPTKLPISTIWRNTCMLTSVSIGSSFVWLLRKRSQTDAFEWPGKTITRPIHGKTLILSKSQTLRVLRGKSAAITVWTNRNVVIENSIHNPEEGAG